jgi:hypothetical protein
MSGQPPRKGISAAAVMEAALFFRTPWLILAMTPLLFVWVYIFWGWTNLGALVWFSAGVLGTAVAWAVQGWEPWNMALNQVMRGGALRPENYSPIQKAALKLFKTPHMKLVQAFWIGAGATLPWPISGVSLLVNGRPFRAWPPAQWWVMLIFGVGEAIRGRALALHALAGQLQKNWPELLKSVDAEA